MNALTFDTLAYVKRLREAGMENAQAEAQAEALSLAIQDSVATKNDIAHLEARLSQTELVLKSEIREAQVTGLKWLVPLLVGQTAVLAALVKLL